MIRSAPIIPTIGRSIKPDPPAISVWLSVTRA